MNQTVKHLWINALRSGKYKQGLAALKNRDNKFCCLGVLCDLHRIETQGEDWGEDPNISETLYLGQSGILPAEVVSWAGLEHFNPKIGDSVATTLNDVEKLSFDLIADLIERNL